MSARPFVNDALWRCLCPAYRPATLQGSFSGRPLARAARNGLRNPRNVRHHSSFAATASTSNTPGQTHSYRVEPLGFTQNEHTRQPQAARHARQDKKEKAKTSLVLLPTIELYEQLRTDAAAGRHDEVMNIVRILIKDRGERPNVRLYAGILHSFVSPEMGTAGKVRKVLEEMEEEGIELDSGACHCVLEALAVHPDYLLREEILGYMQDRWFTLTDRGHNMIVAGLLRDRLFEQALHKIEDMLAQRIIVADWLLDKAIWLMLDYTEIEEAWQLLQTRQSSGRSSVSQGLWMQFLDVASRRGHVNSTQYIWTERVSPSYLNPPTGTCMHVLTLASRHGLVKLATDVFRVLTARDTILTCHHYELLLEAYLNAKDLHAALSVLLIMGEAGIRVDEASTAPLYYYLKQVEPKSTSAVEEAGAATEKTTETRPMRAFKTLQSFALSSPSRQPRIPVAAVNACISASINLPSAPPPMFSSKSTSSSGLSDAIEMYKALHTLCATGPTTQTFNILFQGCHKEGRKELAMYLAEEMGNLNLRPDALTYDRLILVCCAAGMPSIQSQSQSNPIPNITSTVAENNEPEHHDDNPQIKQDRTKSNQDILDAFLYFEEMSVQGFKARRGTYEVLIQAGLAIRDQRVMGVWADMKEAGFRLSREIERSVAEAFPEAHADEIGERRVDLNLGGVHGVKVAGDEVGKLGMERREDSVDASQSARLEQQGENALVSGR